MPASRRPGFTGHRGQSLQATPVGVDQVDRIASREAADEGQPGPIGRPNGRDARLKTIRELYKVRSIPVHQVEVVATSRIRMERDPARRDRWEWRCRGLRRGGGRRRSGRGNLGGHAVSTTAGDQRHRSGGHCASSVPSNVETYHRMHVREGGPGGSTGIAARAAQSQKLSDSESSKPRRRSSAIMSAGSTASSTGVAP